MCRRRFVLVALSHLLCATALQRSLPAEEPTAIFLMNIDGSHVRRVADVDDYPVLGFPRWSHDGKLLAFDGVAGDPNARRWYIVHADGSRLRVMGLGGQADWSADDKQLLFTIADKALLPRGIWVQNFDGRGRVALTTSGQQPRWSPLDAAVTFLDEGALHVLDPVDSSRRKLPLPAGNAIGFDWSPDGKQLAVVMKAAKESELWIVDAANSEKHKKLVAGNLDASIAWSPDGKQLAISLAGKIQLVSATEPAMPELIAGQEGTNRMPAWSPDGQSIAFVSTRTQPARGTVAQANRRVQLEEEKRHTRGNIVYGLDLSHDGNRVLLGGKQDLEIWDFDKDETQRFDFRGEWVSLSPDGQTVALCGPLIKVALGDLKSGKPIRDLHIGSMCTNVDFSSDGKRLVCGTIDKQAIAFDVASGKRLSVFERHHAPITRVAFLPGSDEAASNGQDKSLRIWNVQTGQERLAIAHPDVPWGLAVSPDGQLIATGTGGPTEGNPIIQRILDGDEHVIRLWDAASGELVRELSGHTGIVYTLAFSPDGRTLASGGWDGLISLWDVATGRQLAAVQGQGSAYGVAITPDGSKLVVGGGENRSAGAQVRRYPAEQVRVFKIVEEESTARSAVQ